MSRGISARSAQDSVKCEAKKVATTTYHTSLLMIIAPPYAHMATYFVHSHSFATHTPPASRSGWLSDIDLEHLINLVVDNSGTVMLA